MWPILTACVLGLACGMPARAGNPSTNAASATTAKNPSGASTEKTQTANLGKINVTALRELVKTLQVVKVALKQPLSSDPAQANTVVCRIITGHGHLHVEERMGAVLKCFSNSWYFWQQDACHNAGIAQCASGLEGSAYKRPGAWVSDRTLNFQQLMHFRQLLKDLPEPGEGEVVVVDAKGKTLVTIKAGDQSKADGTN
jgi:hypothetical protein